MSENPPHQPPDLGALRRLMNEASVRPWSTCKPGHGHPTEYLCVQFSEGGDGFECNDQYTTLELKPADAKLIVAAMNALPHLLARAEAADRAERERDDARALEKAAWDMREAEAERCKYEVQCCCMADRPGDVCMVHSPAVRKAEQERDAARAEAAQVQAKLDKLHAGIPPKDGGRIWNWDDPILVPRDWAEMAERTICWNVECPHQAAQLDRSYETQVRLGEARASEAAYRRHADTLYVQPLLEWGSGLDEAGIEACSGEVGGFDHEKAMRELIRRADRERVARAEAERMRGLITETMRSLELIASMTVQGERARAKRGIFWDWRDEARKALLRLATPDQQGAEDKTSE